MINISFKNIAHAVKEWAIRLFSIYFYVYALLILFLAVSGQKYLAVSIVLTLFLLLNTFLKIKLNKKFTYINIGVKYTICLIIFFITYFVLSLLNKCILSSFIFIFSVLSLFGVEETSLFLIEWINKLISEKENKIPDNILGKPYLSKMFSLENVWDKDKFQSDEISKMLYEFINISNDNQMGHVVVRSMTSTDENNVQKIYVKAKDGYHIIIKGKLEYIAKMCSDVISNGELVSLNDELVNSLNDKLTEFECADNIFCAFKEVDSLEHDEENNYILTGCGVYDNEVIKAPDKQNTIKITPAKTHNLVLNIFSLLISTILLGANIFASIFNATVFNAYEIILAAVLCFVFATVVSYCGSLLAVNKKNKCAIFVFSVICVCVSYFLGRYIMFNADYENDLFYVVTANVMTITSLVGYIMFIIISICEFINLKSRIIATICCFILLSYMFVPPCCKLLEGYNISYIYISTAYLISIVGAILSSILYFLLRKKENGTKISN